jgi:transcription factor WhiB
MNDEVPCAGRDPKLWFAPAGLKARERAVYYERAFGHCQSCPEVRSCARSALDNDERGGMWAGVDTHPDRNTCYRSRLEYVAQHGLELLELPPVPPHGRPAPCTGGCGRLTAPPSRMYDMYDECVPRRGLGMCHRCHSAHRRRTAFLLGKVRT